jgi:hypothetical protein
MLRPKELHTRRLPPFPEAGARSEAMPPSATLRLHRIHCGAGDPCGMAERLLTGLPGETPSFSLLFCSPRVDADALAEALAPRIRGPWIGCTTAGEIVGPEGYLEEGALLVCVHSPAIQAAAAGISGLDHFDPTDATEVVNGLRAGLEAAEPMDPARHFALLLVDGLAQREERVVASLYAALAGVPVIGGSAGDGLRFRRTRVLHGGRFHDAAAAVLLVRCALPFEVFGLHHFEPTPDRLVITAADAPRRIVSEINGYPAAAEYARLVGVALDDLNPMIFAAHPVMHRIGGEFFIRSIQCANLDGSLTFYCAIEPGLVLTIGRPGDIVGHLEREVSRLKASLPGLSLVLGCECILRRIELEMKGGVPAVERLLAELPFVGFSTYGEQFNGIHVNQTLTGVAIGG